MSRGSDLVTLGGAAVAGIISISSAEGRYEPFDATVGIVLAILLACFYRPPAPSGWPDALRQAAAAGAVFALVFCLVIAPIVDASVAPLSANLSDARATELTVVVSYRLFWTWLIAFVPLVMVTFGFAVRPRNASPQAKALTLG
ncbi:hypothetical protein [Actinoplanes solisilvae]|uniref:hypothetical protein n=1 Tax=Actinoplanes solisilvae TaxID=2486853 RepID=UPI000FD981B5|nr:hypothetical protein [Actinoplanes solisilvae]